jgi:hypothetical protein
MVVKYQLGLTEDTPLTRQMADTVTTLDLSAYGLDDIRDLVYFPNLQSLDISYNRLENISALSNMQYLTYLDLSCNRLRTLNDLAFSESVEMLVFVGGNYIRDYSLLLENPKCLFKILGLDNQILPYRVDNFYTDFDPDTYQSIINYNVWAYSKYDSLYVLYDGKRELVIDHSDDIQIRENISDDIIYLILDDQTIDSTCFVLPKTINIADTSIIIVPDLSNGYKVFSTTIVPDLPDGYKVLSVEAFQSDVSFQNETIYFKMAENISEDTIRIGFGESDSDAMNKIKGYTYYYVTSVPVWNESIRESKHLVYPNPVDNTFTVQIPNPDGERAEVALINLSGQIVYRTETNEAVCHVDVQSLKRGVYILQVVVGKEKYVAKVIKK